MEKELLELKSKLAELDKQSVEFKAVKDGYEALEKKHGELLTLMATEKKENADALELKLKAYNEEVKKLQDDIIELKEQEEEHKSLESAFIALSKKEDFIKARDNKEFKGAGKTFEFKLDTSVMTGNIGTSLVREGINMARTDVNAITPLFNVIPMGAAKNRVVWVEGAYVSNAGYLDELAAATNDTGTAQEYSRGLSKIGAKLKVSAEMLEDLPALAAKFQLKMKEYIDKFLNGELLTGLGADTTAATQKKVYGLIPMGSTAFVAGALATSITLPTIDDLVACMVAQADKYMPTAVIISKIDAVKYGRVKDTSGQLIIREVNGLKMLGGLRVIETTNMPVGSLLVVDEGVLELYVKRAMEFKIAQEGTDFSTDQYTAVLFWRGQALVEAIDKAANIYVADIATALTAITKA